MRWAPQRAGTLPDREPSAATPGFETTIDHWIDMAAFSTPAQYNYGNAGRNILYGPGATNFDFNLFKRLGEAGELPSRFEGFNVLNHPQCGQPSTKHLNYGRRHHHVSYLDDETIAGWCEDQVLTS